MTVNAASNGLHYETPRSLFARAGQLWAYRHLVGNLVWRDLSVRYKNSILGFFWSLASPLLMMLVFWLVFSKLRGSNIRDFHLFVLTTILPWNWFSVAIAGGMRSIVNNSSLINKVYFPREVLPISVVLAELVNFLFALPVLLIMLFAAGIPLTVHALWLPFIILIQLAFTLGMVLLLATANVYYRDTSVIMDVVLLAWFFLTPIVYSITELMGTLHLPGGVAIEGSRLLLIANPMASIINAYREVLYGSPAGPPAHPELKFLLRTALTAIAVLMAGYAVFVRHSGRFGEEV